MAPSGDYTYQERQRVAVVDPGTHISFLFARCRPTRPHYVAAADAAADAATLGSLLIEN